MRVLIIGGYGTFGFRMAECLMNEAGLEIVIAGRSLEKTEAACAKLSGAANAVPLRLDRNTLVLDTVPDLIIDASGPFQAYAGSPVVEYALQHSCDYADISDDGAFVAAIRARQGEAETARVSLVSGLSTCPVLSAIGLREIEAAIGPVTSAIIGIAPSPRAPLGRNVVAAVASYAGRPRVPVRRDGEVRRIAGLTESREETICVPGDIPLPRLPFSVADAPDAHVLPQNFPQLENIWTGAGTRPVWLHRSLVGISHLVRMRLLPPLTPLAGLFHKARGLFQSGVHRGGMFVRGETVTDSASWHLVAEGDQGPYIPALPAVALVRRYLRDGRPAPGTYSGDEIIDLEDLQPELDTFDIAHGLHFDAADLSPYETVLGTAYARLDPVVRDLHRTGEGRRFTGQCDIIRGKNPLAWCVATVFRFPESGRHVPVTVEITPDAKGEIWTRHFDGKRMQSHHALGRGRWARYITESFGPVAVHMAITELDGTLHLHPRGWSLFGLPLPRALCPGGDMSERQIDGRFHLHVDIKAPLFGRLCKYEGWVEPESYTRQRCKDWTCHRVE